MIRDNFVIPKYIILPWNIAYEVENHYSYESLDRVLCVLEAGSVALLVEMRVLESSVDEKVDRGEEDERDDPSAEQPGPVGVVHDVERVQSRDRLV